MSLRLRQAIAGRPSVRSRQSYAVLTHNGKGFIAYTSLSNVIVLDSDFELNDTLDFWSSLPPRAAGSSSQGITGLTCVSERGLIIAWSERHVVIWQRRSDAKTRREWEVQSTLVASAAITCMDFNTSSWGGTLVLGTLEGIESWRMDASMDIIVWDCLWHRQYPSPSSIVISAVTGHIAWFRDGDRTVNVLAVNVKGMAVGAPQGLRHPRETAWIGWRRSTATNSDPFLYTITTNSVLRIYSPVLDDPSWFQLLLTLDSKSFAPPPVRLSGKGKAFVPPAMQGQIWPLDAEIIRAEAILELETLGNQASGAAAQIRKILESLAAEECDVFVWLGDDGSVALRSVINMDRKPPTLLKSIPLSRSPPSATLKNLSPTSRLLTVPDPSTLLAICHPTPSDELIDAYRISFSSLLSSDESGIVPLFGPSKSEDRLQLSQPISHFVRTPNGRGLLAVGQDNEMAAWYADNLGRSPKHDQKPQALVSKGLWTLPHVPIATAIFAKGRAIVSYSRSNSNPQITLQHLEDGSLEPSATVRLPSFSLDPDDEVEMLLAVSDIDDGLSARGRRTQKAYVMAASRNGRAWVWRLESRFAMTSASESFSTTTASIAQSPSTYMESRLASAPPEISLSTTYLLPVEEGSARFILPVDPMGWHQSVIDWQSNVPLQDMVLTISNSGVLEFWSPELGHHFKRENPHDAHIHVNGYDDHQHGDLPWTRTGVVHTGISNATMARCSSRKKTVLIRECDGGRHEMTIWDSKTSEFSTGLELTHMFEQGEHVQDLDWTTTSDLQSVLAVGFPHKVVLVCEQRLSYVEEKPGWAPFLVINMEQYTSLPIADSIWLAGGSLVVGTGNQMYLFFRFLDRETPIPSPAASARHVDIGPEEPEDLFQLIASENGPLWDYHPTVLAQCLLWNKIDLVKSILTQLLDDLKSCKEDGRKRLRYQRLDPSAFFTTKKLAMKKDLIKGKYDGLFDATPVEQEDDDDDQDFPPRLVNELIDRLDGPVRIPLNQTEKSLLATVAQATLEVERQRRSLDLCGLRFLLSIRMYVNRHRRSISGSATPSAVRSINGVTPLPSSRSISNQETDQDRLSFRNVVWAMHSESQDVLLSAANETCRDGKMTWKDANTLGVFCWLRSTEVVKSQLEVIARNRFMADEDRDPTSCSLIFFALGKKKVVHGLWRQAPGHSEQQMMLKFLANDFELERWKTAAVKNAYALLSKQRYEYAAAFFMLGGYAKDAINVVLRNLQDWQLAFALARAVEGGLDGPLVKSIVSDTVLRRAFEGGHRWLASWGFWILGRRDLAVRVIISPMTEVAESWSTDHLDVGNPSNDDPSLLLLFQHLKSKSLQTAKGTSEIPEKMEFDFVLHNARVFGRLGCHALGLDLMRSWSFTRPFFPPAKTKKRIPSAIATPSSISLDGLDGGTPKLSRSNSVTLGPKSSPSSRLHPSPRRPSFMLSGRPRGESMIMDMDVLAEGESEPVTRVPSPIQDSPVQINGTKGETTTAAAINGDHPDLSEKNLGDAATETKAETPTPRKVGNLMKEIKQDVQQGGMEFNMDNFF